MRNFILLIIILGLFVGITGYYYYQKNIYSKEVLKLEILGENEVEIGQIIEYVVKYKNDGNMRLENPILIFECPKNSLECTLKGKEETAAQKKSLRKSIYLPTIYPREEKIIKIRARLLGRENEIKIAEASLSYQPKNLKAHYESSTTFTTKIKKVPLIFTFDLPTKTESARDVEFRLNYFSNVDWPLVDLRCVIEYPLDFQFIKSKPEALEKTEWEIPLLNKTQGGRIEVFGKIRGEVGEKKLFKAKLGIWQEGEFVLLEEIVKGIEIIKPSLYISQQINNNPEYIAEIGDLLHYEIFFTNIGQEPLTNLVLTSKLEGKSFDLFSLKAPSGEFELGDDLILFEGRKNSFLEFLDIQEGGKVEFWVRLKGDLEMKNLSDKNPVLVNRIYLSQARKAFTTKINSKIEIVQKGYFQNEFFENSGPLPPEVEKTTTYAILWQVKNYHSDVKNVIAKVTLPEEINFTGKIFPEDSKLTYDSESKEIVWQVGDLKAGVGVLTSPITCVFQISLKPSQEQKGGIAKLTNEVKISGEDEFTGQTLRNTFKALDTTLPDDETITEEQWFVQ